MKDPQGDTGGPVARIPFISATLHCIAMTALVYLRSSFGYVFLSPKSVFWVFSYSIILFSIYAWCEPDVWRECWIITTFSVGAVVLYNIHLLTAFSQQLYYKGKHDLDSGTSHLLRILPVSQQGENHFASTEVVLHLWVEPALILLLSSALRIVLGEYYLSTWLFVVAICCWLKEALNFWIFLRRRKRQQDRFSDLEHAPDIDQPPPTHSSFPPTGSAPQTGRSTFVPRPREETLTPEEELKERYYAQVLKLKAPYTLEMANKNYLTLIKEVHEDTAGKSDENHEKSVELNAAIAYFRKKSG